MLLSRGRLRKQHLALTLNEEEFTRQEEELSRQSEQSMNKRPGGLTTLVWCWAKACVPSQPEAVRRTWEAAQEAIGPLRAARVGEGAVEGETRHKTVRARKTHCRTKLPDGNCCAGFQTKVLPRAKTWEKGAG